MPVESVFFLSEGKMNELRGQTVTPHASTIADGYIQKIKEIKAKNEWKQNGAGFMFMGGRLPTGDDAPAIPLITGIAPLPDGTLAYALATADMSGIYIKDFTKPTEKDGYILVKNGLRLFDLDAHNGRMTATAADSHIERHIVVISPEHGTVSACTEGECFDANPRFSRKEADVLLYDSCGHGYDSKMQFVRFGPKSIYRLHVATGDLEEVLEGGDYEYFRPYEAADGTLYCIRRPYRDKQDGGMSFMDILLFLPRVLKGLFGWLNFFTQRYAGETLKSSGANPSKMQQKTQEELFVEGNLLEAEKNLKENAARGEKNAGYAPASWELVAKRPDGRLDVLRKGVLDYCIMADGAAIISNGKHILQTGKDETLLGTAHLGVKLAVMPE